MASRTDINLAPLNDFLSGNPHIHHATPSSPDYDTLRATYIINDALKPALIVRPRSAGDVAGLVSVLASHAIPFTVRAGGHDMFGRSVVTGTVTIDMRDISHVEIDRESRTARVGGGAVTGDIATALAKEGLATATPTIPVVGFAGWATHGGYGIFSSKYGMGADQIVGAKVVNAEGKIVDADERVLKGIRGAGGAFGVVVEMTIRVYEAEAILGGMIMYKSEDLPATIKAFNDGYRRLYEEGLPAELGVQQAVVNSPQGKALALFFVWNSSDMEAGDMWLNKICSLSPLAMSNVTKTTVVDWLNLAGSMVASSTAAAMICVCFKNITPDVLDLLASYGEKMPSVPNTMFAMHQVREGPATSADARGDSVFAAREPHYMLEIFATASSADASSLEETLQWGQQFRDALQQTESGNLLPTRFLPFVPPERVDLRQVYQDRYELLADLKREYDPQNVFSLALARF